MAEPPRGQRSDSLIIIGAVALVMACCMRSSAVSSSGPAPRRPASATAGQPDIRTRPFLGLEDPRQLVPDGTIVRDGAVLHRLRSTELYRPPVTRVVPLSGGEIPTSTITLELLVTAEGVPVEATFKAHVPADLSAGQPAIDATATYRFSQVGGVDPIAAPKL